MHIKNPFVFTSLFLTLTLLVSCQQPSEKDSGISEGYVEYRMEYLSDSTNEQFYKFLPNKMKLFFKNHNTKNSIGDMAGIVEFTHIKNFQEGTYTTLVDLFDKQYKYVEKSGNHSIFFRSRPEMRIEPTEETQKIAGYTCRKFNVYDSGQQQKQPTHAIYSTDKINIRGFTDLTPYQGIGGVLLNFELQIYQIPVKMIATRVVKKDIEEEEFNIPSEYKKVNKQTMLRIIEVLK